MSDFTIINMHGSREFCKRGSKFDHFFFLSFFLVDEGEGCHVYTCKPYLFLFFAINVGQPFRQTLACD